MSKPPRTSLSDALGSTLNTEGSMGDMDSTLAEHAESNTEGALDLHVTPPTELQGFDFGEVPAEALAEIGSLRRAIVVKLSAVVVAVGNDLLRLQELIELHCKRGTWTRFLETGLPFSESSARNYVRAAKADKRLSDGATVAGKVSPTVLYEIRNAPVEILREIERRVDEGETVTGRDVRNMRLALQQSTPVDSVLNSSVDAETEDLRSGDTQQNAARSGALPKVVPTPLLTGAKSSQAAATELVARLRDYFEDDRIAELDELWLAAGPGAVRSLLSV